MHIKGVKPTGRYISGHYSLVNKDKYVGKTPIIYRSSWERQICLYCDKNDSILKWSSESMEIKYISPLDNKWHRYYPDFYMKVERADGKIVEFVVEVKPHAKLSKPKKPKSNHKKVLERYNANLKEHLVILTKSKYAKKWAEDRGMRFVFITERDWKKLFFSR